MVLNPHFKHLMLILIVCPSTIEKYLCGTKDDKTSKTRVNIIVYDYTLTKVEHLRKLTIDIIWRHHLVLDNDNALIGTFENEEEESQ